LIVFLISALLHARFIKYRANDIAYLKSEMSKTLLILRSSVILIYLFLFWPLLIHAISEESNSKIGIELAAVSFIGGLVILAINIFFMTYKGKQAHDDPNARLKSLMKDLRKEKELLTKQLEKNELENQITELKKKLEAQKKDA
jgi:hypothetical protein